MAMIIVVSTKVDDGIGLAGYFSLRIHPLEHAAREARHTNDMRCAMPGLASPHKSARPFGFSLVALERGVTGLGQLVALAC